MDGLIVRSLDSYTGLETDASVRMGGSLVALTNRRFSHTFHSSDSPMTVGGAPGYIDKTLSLNIQRRRLAVDWTPRQVPLNQTFSLTVLVTDAAVDSRVDAVIVIQSPGRRASDPQPPSEGYRANEPFDVLLRARTVIRIDESTGDRFVEVLYPSARVMAPDYVDGVIQFFGLP